ncbi:MAG: hypothetical protein KF716_08735 [Anaerolineae bacterium]|nr:hypothetical protein [Anaerolineae bacterium]
MADQILELVGDLRLGLHDNGDGSYAIKAYLVGGSGGGAGGDASAANQETEIGHLAAIETAVESIDSSSPALGQTTKANSVPVAIASDQDIATSAKQDTGNTSLNTIAGRLPTTLGQTTKAASLPVAVASDQVLNAQTYLHSGTRIWEDMTGPTDGSNGATIGAVGLFVTNNATADRLRNNHEMTVLASAARTAATNSSDQVNYNGRHITVTIDVTAGTGFSITPTIKYKDSLSGKYVTLLAGASIVATGTVTLQVGPGLPDTTNLSANKPAPRIWRLEIAVADTTSATYSVSVNYTN